MQKSYRGVLKRQPIKNSKKLDGYMLSLLKKDMSEKVITMSVSLLLFIIGFGLLIWQGDYYTALALFFIVWANNLATKLS